MPVHFSLPLTFNRRTSKELHQFCVWLVNCTQLTNPTFRDNRIICRHYFSASFHLFYFTVISFILMKTSNSGFYHQISQLPSIQLRLKSIAEVSSKHSVEEIQTHLSSSRKTALCINLYQMQNFPLKILKATVVAASKTRRHESWIIHFHVLHLQSASL